MIVQGEHRRTIQLVEDDPTAVRVIDQRRLPFELSFHDIGTADEAAAAIRDMIVRGAPLIGVTAAYGLYLAALAHTSGSHFHDHMARAASMLKSARPTAVNLAWAVDRQLAAIAGCDDAERCAGLLLRGAEEMAREDVEWCRAIGEHGLPLIEEIAARKKGERVNILTHCNAGWLACVDYGTATSPIYMAHDRGIDLHVWVDETRPRNQGGRLTAWELGQHGVPHTVIADNTGGHLMQHAMVDMVIVGSDRATITGDICNKIGTYLKALAAHDNGVPFYAALPSSTIDWRIRDGVAEIPIEERESEEVLYMEGMDGDQLHRVLITPVASPAVNYGFDVTPARLVTGLITERGLCAADEESILNLFPERRSR